MPSTKATLLHPVPHVRSARVAFGRGEAVFINFQDLLAPVRVSSTSLLVSPGPSPCILCVGSRAKEETLSFFLSYL